PRQPARAMRGLLLLALAWLLATPAANAEEFSAEKTSITVLAPTNLATKLSRMIRLYTASTGMTVSAQYAPSSELAQRISDGEPADLFISADREWLTYVRQRGLTDVFSEARLFSDRLVLASATASLMPPVFRSEQDIAAYMEDPLHVAETVYYPDPAISYYGAFMQAALLKTPLWPLLSPRLVTAPDIIQAQTGAIRETAWVLTLESAAASNAKLHVAYRFGEALEYYGVVVAGENMAQARMLLEYAVKSNLGGN
ncbi:MAG: molybdate ABC transporter substrate-binding protein, partial [Alphaproteobacteria bacterium]|nr:molybdate ABC transporter substrate-binding protein [Alphaproteobacteria bacterium]